MNKQPERDEPESKTRDSLKRGIPKRSWPKSFPREMVEEAMKEVREEKGKLPFPMYCPKD